MWKVSFRKRYQKELYAKRRGQLIEKLKSLQAMECKVHNDEFQCALFQNYCCT